MKQQMMVIVLGVAIAAGGGFFAGTKYQQTKRGQFFTRGSANFSGRGAGTMMGTGNGMRGGLRPVGGEIMKTDAKSITVKLPDGSSKIILLSEKTQINKASEGTISDLISGTQVAVFGSENADGSVTAQNIQINPILRRMEESTPSAK
ncbi:MAG: hypothetical protein ACOY3M_06715 [Patescibacteria group bacterium]